jgi:hypothetical protein
MKTDIEELALHKLPSILLIRIAARVRDMSSTEKSGTSPFPSATLSTVLSCGSPVTPLAKCQANTVLNKC